MTPVAQTSASLARRVASAASPEHFYTITQLPNPLAMLSDSLSAFANQCAFYPVTANQFRQR